MKLAHLYKFDWYTPHQAWLAERGLPHHAHYGAKPERANLRFTDLRYADLHSANLNYANLRDADLRYVDLYSANLSYVELYSADLRFTDLRDANLSCADLRYANLGFASLRDADLRDAKLHHVIGNRKEIKTIQTDPWPIVLTKDVMAIGYEQHSIEEWRGFDDDRIASMDDDALEWSRTWRPIIEQIIEVNAA